MDFKPKRSSAAGYPRSVVWLVTVMAPMAAAPAADPDPLPFPVYVACRLSGPIELDGKLNDPVWRETSLGWGMSDSIQPNVLCPDVTLFRVGHDGAAVFIALACYNRQVREEIPDHIWKPRESEMMDMQAVPRYDRMRGIIPPTNTADLLISHQGRTVTIHFEPPEPPSLSVHDSLGERPLRAKLEWAYSGSMEDPLWTCEVRATWSDLGFPAPAGDDEWALNIYRDIRFFSNWSFIGWMRQWDKVEYSRYDLTERFGRLLFTDRPAQAEIEAAASKLRETRGPLRVFLPDMLLLVEGDGRLVRQRYAERLEVLRAYGADILNDRQRIGNDLPVYPFFSEKKHRDHLTPASQKLSRLAAVLKEPLLSDDPACGVARISHAIPEAREGLYAWKKERLYRGLPE